MLHTLGGRWRIGKGTVAYCLPFLQWLPAISGGHPILTSAHYAKRKEDCKHLLVFGFLIASVVPLVLGNEAEAMITKIKTTSYT